MPTQGPCTDNSSVNCYYRIYVFIWSRGVLGISMCRARPLTSCLHIHPAQVETDVRTCGFFVYMESGPTRISNPVSWDNQKPLGQRLRKPGYCTSIEVLKIFGCIQGHIQPFWQTCSICNLDTQKQPSDICGNTTFALHSLLHILKVNFYDILILYIPCLGYVKSSSTIRCTSIFWVADDIMITI